MPQTEQARRFMCAVCGGKVKARPGQKLPSKAVACEQCTAQVKKTIREEVERESPTKRFLMKFAAGLTEQLPAAIVKDVMRRARGHAGGTGKIRMMEKAALTTAERKKLPKTSFVFPDKAPGPGSYPIPDETRARAALGYVARFGSPAEQAKVRAAVKRKFPNIGKSEGDDSERTGVLIKSVANYGVAPEAMRQRGQLCSSCDFRMSSEEDGLACSVVEGSIQAENMCSLYRPQVFVKSQPDADDVHVNRLLSSRNGEEEEIILCSFESPDDIQEAE